MVISVIPINTPNCTPEINGHVRNKAYVREYPHKIWSYMVQYLHFRILKFQLKKYCL